MVHSAVARQALSSLPSSCGLSTHPTALLPFLYQTCTIRQRAAKRSRTWQRARIHSGRVSRARIDGKLDEDVPFDDGTITAPVERKSTITDVERQTFARLFNMALAGPVQTPGSKKKKKSAVQAPRSASEELDKILAQAVPGLQPSARPELQGEEFVNRFPASLRKMAASAQEKVVQKEREKELLKQAVELEKKRDPVKEQRESEAQRVEGLMRTAKTDMDLWKVLEQEAFSVVKRLDLYHRQQKLNTNKASKVKSKKSQKKEDADEAASPAIETAATETSKEPVKEEALPDLRIIGPNYPSFLLLAIRQLRQEFPSSLLTFSLLPAVKRLGRISYALGASTLLYNELIAAHWHTYADFQGIDDILQDMDNGGIDFDASTLDLLHAIRKQWIGVQHGRFGGSMAAVWGLESTQRGLWKVQRWQKVIRDRMEAEALRLAQEQEVLANEREMVVEDRIGF